MKLSIIENIIVWITKFSCPTLRELCITGLKMQIDSHHDFAQIIHDELEKGMVNADEFKNCLYFNEREIDNFIALL